MHYKKPGRALTQQQFIMPLREKLVSGELVLWGLDQDGKSVKADRHFCAVAELQPLVNAAYAAWPDLVLFEVRVYAAEVDPATPHRAAPPPPGGAASANEPLDKPQRPRSQSDCNKRMEAIARGSHRDRGEKIKEPEATEIFEEEGFRPGQIKKAFLKLSSDLKRAKGERDR